MTTASGAPLGIRADATLTSAQRAALEVLDRCDLSPVRDRLIRTGVMLPRWGEEAVFEFRRYLGIRAVFPEPITMLSPDVDEVWHMSLLFTRLYADLCEATFGYFLHHDPAMEPNPDREGTWAEFERAYRKLYGEPGPLWQVWKPLLEEPNGSAASGRR